MENQYRQSKNYFGKILTLALVVFLVSLSFWTGFTAGKNQTGVPESFIPAREAVFTNREGSDKTVDFSLFWKTLDVLREKYIDAGKLDSSKILYGAIRGMLQSTGDSYTVFLDPDENKEFGQDISGSFQGIGAEIGVKQGVLTVIAPLQGSPAEKAGLRPGDRIIKIDGEVASEMTLDGAVKKMRGEKNTEVILTIWRNGDEETKEIRIIRDLISVKSVTYEMKNSSVAYVKITRFAEDTARDFTRSVNELASQGAESFILDLRSNPGGYLDAAISVANKMLPKDSVILMEENEKGERENIISRGGDILSRYRTVVLINEGSASASEILAAALRENRDNVTLVGIKSFGKGSVQEFVDLPRGTAAKITVARWLTPKGNQINEAGISPDVEIDLSSDDYNNDRDPQLDKALEILSQ